MESRLGSDFGSAIQGKSEGLAGILSGLFGHSGDPYKDAMKEYQKYYGQAQGAQNPFFQAGTGALPDYQDWLSKMKDPSQFINNMMGQYQESPFAKFQQQQGIRAAQNLGSASGLTGSTPLSMQTQQNAQNISSQDQNQWLQNALGINKEYGSGMEGLVGRGQNSANMISQLLSHLGEKMGEGKFGQKFGEQQDRNNIFGGLLKLLTG